MDFYFTNSIDLHMQTQPVVADSFKFEWWIVQVVYSNADMLQEMCLFVFISHRTRQDSTEICANEHKAK